MMAHTQFRGGGTNNRKQTPGRMVELVPVYGKEDSPFGVLKVITGYSQVRVYPVPQYSRLMTAEEKKAAKERKAARAVRRAAKKTK